MFLRDSRDILCHIWLFGYQHKVTILYLIRLFGYQHKVTILYISYIRLFDYQLTIYLVSSSVMENNHLSLLQQLCRLCGNTIVLRLGYVTPKTVTDYSSTIYSVYKIDCETENPDVFPKLLCRSCNCKLSRLQKKSTVPSHDAHHFVPHDHRCIICKAAYPTGHKFSNHMKVFDNTMEKYNFKHLIVSTVEKRIYTQSHLKGNDIINKLVVVIYENSEWKFIVYGRAIDKSNKYLANLPTHINDDNIARFAQHLSQLRVCEGNTSYSDVVTKKL